MHEPQLRDQFLQILSTPGPSRKSAGACELTAHPTRLVGWQGMVLLRLVVCPCRWVPPSLRNRQAGGDTGDSMRRREENSVRVTNLSEDTREDDLRVRRTPDACCADNMMKPLPIASPSYDCMGLLLSQAYQYPSVMHGACIVSPV